MRAERAHGWGWLPAVVAPVALIGGWTLAAALRPGGFDATLRSISSLAAQGMPYRWVMTAGLIATGLAHIGTAAALSPARTPGRAVHALGGLATVGVGLLPLPADGGGSTGHAITAAVAFGALAIWPALAVRGERTRRPVVLSPGAGIAATLVLLAGVGWFVAELVTDGPRLGLAERVAVGMQAVWPLAVWLGCRRVW